MPQLRVYRSFIKKAADSGKYLIIWDDKRRYEGQFKGFDPQGEFVILVNVLIKDETEEIESPEILIPIENIKIVSTETESERSRRRKLKAEVESGILMPGVTPESVKDISAHKPEKLFFKPEQIFQKESKESFEGEIQSKKTEKSAENKLEKVPTLETEEKKEAILLPQEKSEKKPEIQGENIGEEKIAGEELVSVIDKEFDASILSPETRELIEKLSLQKKAKEDRPSSEALKSSKVSEETSPNVEIMPTIETVKQPMNSQIVIPKPEILPNETFKKSEVSAQTKQNEETVEKVEPKEFQSKTTTAVIEEKSKKAASSTLFKKAAASKPEIPKRRIDLGTLILDIIIVILSIVAIGILAVTLFDIKLPFF